MAKIAAAFVGRLQLCAQRRKPFDQWGVCVVGEVSRHVDVDAIAFRK